MVDLGSQPEVGLGTDAPEGYRETQIGLVPECWKVVRLGDAVNEIVSGDWGVAEQASGLIAANALRGTDFARAAQGLLENVPTRYLKEKSIQKRQIRAGDALVELSGGSKDQPTGRILLVSQRVLQQSANPLVFSNFVKRLRVKEETFNPTFFGYLWASLYERGHTRIYEKRTTGIRNFKLADFLEHEYAPVPALPEQQAIAHILSTVQKAIETTEKVIEASRELKRSLMNHLFTYGPVPVDEAEQVPLKDTEIGLVPEHWDTVQLGSLSHVQSGGTPSRKQNQFYGGHIQWVKSLDLNEGVVTNTQEKITDEGLRSIRGKVRPVSTVMIAMYGGAGTIGKSGMLGIPAATNQAVCCVEPNPNKFSSEFLLHYFVHVRPAWMKHAIGTRKDPNISKGVIQRSHIPLPPLHEQQEISRMLGTIDVKIAVEENRKQTLEVLLKTLLHNLMSGKIRVGDLNVSEVETVR